MDFALNDEQRMLQSLAERFAADRFELPVRPAYRIPDDGFDAVTWSLLAELGFLALPFDEADGGLGGGPVELITVMEVFGRRLVAEPLLASIVLSGGMLARAGSAEQKLRWIDPIMAGRAHVALAWAEHATRFAPARPTTVAREGRGAVRLYGAKTYVLAGDATQAFIVTAQSPAGAPGVYLIEAAAAGLARRAYRLVDGSVATELALDGVIADPMPGGLQALAEAFDDARLAAGAEMVGIMDLLFTATLEYLRTRRQFGATLGSFQALQHRMADQYAATEQARSMLYRAALAPLPERPRVIAAMKSHVSAAAVSLGEECIQLHGGVGVTDELIIGHGHRRILLLANLLGDPGAELQRYLQLTDGGISAIGW